MKITDGGIVKIHKVGLELTEHELSRLISEVEDVQGSKTPTLINLKDQLFQYRNQPQTR